MTPERQAKAVLEGMVTKDPTGEPVKKALIELIAANQGESGNYTALTGADGQFHIDGIAPGRYVLFVERTGYLEVDKHHPRTEGRTLTLSAGQELKSLLIRVQAAAVVEGRVTDEDGEPLSNAQVTVWRQTFASGRPGWEQAGGQSTNDLGEYRIPNLGAGNYFVSVTPPPDLKSMVESAGNAPAGDQKNDPKNAASETAGRPLPTSYVTTYYPGTKDRSQAAPVQLHAGDDFPANFSLTPSPSIAVRGSIGELAPGASAVVVLQSKDLGMPQAAGEVRKNGTFEIRDVAPGSYTVVAILTDATGAARMARQTLQVSAANVDGLRLTPQPGAWLHGHLRVESRTAIGRLAPPQAFLSLVAKDADDDMTIAMPIGEGFSPLARANPDGSFEWKNVPPGHYYVQFSGDDSVAQNWFLKSVTMGGREVNDAGFSTNGGAAVMDLVASADGAVVDGVVADAKSEPVANATVVAVPEARLRSRTDRFRKTVTDQSGRFVLHGLPPGTYTLIAWESMDGEAYYNPEFLKSYEAQGRALHVSEGERKSEQLQVVPAAEDPQ
jgi:protocatechuate 3,4-dioxygenase beta subunit